jgi:hypothetical protein
VSSPVVVLSLLLAAAAPAVEAELAVAGCCLVSPSSEYELLLMPVP